MLQSLSFSLIHSVGISWANRWLFSGSQADSQGRALEHETRSDQRRRQIYLCKAVLLAAHPIQDTRTFRGKLTKDQVTQARELCARVRQDVRKELVAVMLESQMGVLQQATQDFPSALERYSEMLKPSTDAPSQDIIEMRFSSLVEAGRRQIARLEALD